VVVFDGAATGGYQAVKIDTTKLANGRHKLFARGDADFAGANATGTESGALVLLFDVAN
jgi:hypothetical protein